MRLQPAPVFLEFGEAAMNKLGQQNSKVNGLQKFFSDIAAALRVMKIMGLKPNKLIGLRRG